MLKLKYSLFYSVIPVVATSFLYFRGVSESLTFSLVSFIIISIISIFDEDSIIKNITATTLSLLYVGIFSMLSIPIIDKFGGEFIVLIFITIWSTDTFAYLGGVAYGKNKLCPKVSPKKSIEGSITGLLMSVVSVSIFGYYNGAISVKEGILLSVLLSVSGQIGDLFESKLKRECNVKDSSSIIPGHGGILDRFDSFLFAVPTLYVYLYFFKQ